MTSLVVGTSRTLCLDIKDGGVRLGLVQDRSRVGQIVHLDPAHYWALVSQQPQAFGEIGLTHIEKELVITIGKDRWGTLPWIEFVRAVTEVVGGPPERLYPVRALQQ